MAKLNEKQKTLAFEKAVLKGTLDDLKAAYKEIGPIELPARSLGMACRFRGIDFVKQLVEWGFSFRYENTPQLQSKYNNGLTTASHYHADADYVLLLLEKCYCKANVGIDDGYCPEVNSWSPDEQKQRHEEYKDLQIISEEERANIIGYLYENKKESGFNPELMLYYSILSSSEFAISKLRSLGVKLPEEKRKYITEGGKGVDYDDFDMSLRGDSEKIKKNLNYWLEEINPDEKIILYKSYVEQFANDLFSADMYPLIQSRADISKVSKKSLIEIFIDSDNAEAVSICCGENWLEKPALRDQMIDLAISKNKTEVLAVLLDYKNRTANPEAEMKITEQKLKRELNANPLSMTSIKKNFEYKETSETTCSIVKYKGKDTMVIVPEKIGNCYVTVIGKAAFAVKAGLGDLGIRESVRENRRNVERVILPDSIQVIEAYAFSECESLRECNLPESIQVIETYAFKGCKSLKECCFPSSIQKIGNCAFEETAIETADLSQISNINNIPYGLFKNCQKLKTVELPNGIQSIENFAFKGCSSLIDIAFPDSLKTIEFEAFANCVMLKAIDLPDTMTQISDCFNNTGWEKDHLDELGYINRYLIKYKGNWDKIEIKEGTSIIANGCFKGSSVKEVTIPDSIVSIGEGVFEDCKELKTILFGKGVEIIGHNAFANCESLETVDIPENVKSIKTGAFVNCNNLKDLYITANTVEVGRIMSPAFSASLSKKELNPELTIHTSKNSAAEKWAIENRVKIKYDTMMNPDNEESESCHFIIDYPTLVSCYGSAKRVVIEEGINTIGKEAFKNYTELTEVILPNSIERIERSAFSGCENLKSITIPNSVKELGSSVFENCRHLEAATLSDNISEIGWAAFKNCEKLRSIKIPAKVKEISYDAFRDCKILENVEFQGDKIELESGAFYGCESIKKMALPILQNTNSAYACFCQCSALEEITIPKESHIECVADFMFEHCSKLKRIELPKSVKTVGDRAFFGCKELEEVIIQSDSCSNIKKFFGKDVFTESSLQKLYVSEQLEREWKEFPSDIKPPFVSAVASKIVNNTANQFEFDEVIPYILKQKKRIIESGINNPDIFSIIEGKNSPKEKKTQQCNECQKETEGISFTDGVFVTTGLSLKDEAWVKEQVEERGGAFKEGFVKKITCLIINPDYDHETTKLKKTKELITEGRDVKIITFEEFKELL